LKFVVGIEFWVRVVLWWDYDRQALPGSWKDEEMNEEVDETGERGFGQAMRIPAASETLS
jgi:hypothetical protein